MKSQDEMAENENAKLRIKERRRKYYENNKYAICNKTINVYCINKIKKVKGLYGDKVKEYTRRYPFEVCADPYIRKKLATYRIYSSHSQYDDCYDAGMMAYLYSIHRCAEMSYSHTIPYIKKVIGIYIVCAMVVHSDMKNLCQENGFREIRLDAEASFDKY